jgi:hypothetical protein
MDFSTHDDFGRPFFTVVSRFIPRGLRESFIRSVLEQGPGISIDDIPFRKERHKQQVQAELDRLAAL